MDSINIVSRENIQINSFNCRGLRCKSKRLSIFNWLNTAEKGVTLLQETHSDIEIEKKWAKEFGGSIYCSHGTSTSKGVAFLIPKFFATSIKIIDVQAEESGRILVIHCEIASEDLIIFNVYAATKDHTHEQNLFLEKLRELMVKYSDKNILLGGDFNICLDLKLDKNGGKIIQNSSYRTNLIHFMEEYSLVDIWRLRNPNTKYYTRREKCRSGLVQSRLDYFLASRSLEFEISNCNIKPGLMSDHSLIKVELNMKKTDHRGKGTWKFNNNLLRDKQYVTLVKETIQNIKQNVDFTNKNTFWEYLKCQIRSDTISFSILKQKRLRKEESEITAKLEDLEKKLDVNNDEQILEYSNLKRTWENFQYTKTEGTILRSKAKFVEQGERNSRYFLNLEKRNFNERHMKSLINSQGMTITKPGEILEEQASFYEGLYKAANIDNSQDKTFFNTASIPYLKNEQKTILDNPLTLTEISEALKDMSNFKSPGLDGFTTNFYKFFWVDIKDCLFDSYIYSIQHGELSDSQRRGLLSLIPKPGKDVRYMKSWRPVTLLATDYKILAKALATRLQKVMSDLVNHDQVGYIKGENVRIIDLYIK